MYILELCNFWDLIITWSDLITVLEVLHTNDMKVKPLFCLGMTQCKPKFTLIDIKEKKKTLMAIFSNLA